MAKMIEVQFLAGDTITMNGETRMFTMNHKTMMREEDAKAMKVTMTIPQIDRSEDGENEDW